MPPPFFQPCKGEIFMLLRNYALSFFALALLLTLAILSPMPPSATADERERPPRIAILPLELLAPQDLAYLAEGVRTMLSSRLAASGQAELVGRGAVQQALAAADQPRQPAEFAALAAALDADYLLAGSLTSVGGALSLDLDLHGRDGAAPPRSFFASAEDENSVIPAVDRLARELGQAIGTVAAAPARPAAVAEQQPTYVSPHPERQLYGGWGTGASPFIRPTDISWLRGFSKSHDILLGLHAMDVADITGDGEQEFILAGPNRIEVYRRELGRFTRIAQHATLNRYTIHYLSTADLSGDGKAEIYVSAADHQRPNSLVLEWDGNQLVRRHDALPWYIRVMELPMEGQTLVAQRAGAGSYLMPGLFRLQTGSGGELELGTALSVPAQFNLFDFTYVDLDGDGSPEIVAITQGDRLEVMNAAGGLLWRSDDHYGGTTRYLGGIDPMGRETTQPHETARYFVPSRVVPRDITGNGLPEIVLVRNISTLSRVFGKLRSYSGGEIHALRWDGSGMNEVWRTRRISGYLADLQLGPDLELPPQEEGAQAKKGAELFVGVVLRSDGFNILAGSESAIYVYPVEYLPGTTGDNRR